MGVRSEDRKQGKSYSELDFSDGPLRQAPPVFAVPLTPPPSFLADKMAAPRRNISEKERLQGLMRPASMISVVGSERAMSLGPMSTRRRFRAWMVNEGGLRILSTCPGLSPWEPLRIAADLCGSLDTPPRRREYRVTAWSALSDPAHSAGLRSRVPQLLSQGQLQQPSSPVWCWIPQ